MFKTFDLTRPLFLEIKTKCVFFNFQFSNFINHISFPVTNDKLISRITQLYCTYLYCIVLIFLFIDPFEQQNRAHLLTEEEKSFLHNQLTELIACKGKSCTVGLHNNSSTLNRAMSSRYKVKRKFIHHNFGKTIVTTLARMYM